jgi:ribosomal protein S9
VEHGVWSLPPLPLPTVSRRDAAGAANGIGRRKTARAVVNIRPGTGKIKVNGKNFVDYFPRYDLIVEGLLSLFVVLI